ncbi:MAG TPA: histidinol-phosphatase [Gammaproteobacteria bacterium]|nr:histidinol-phosphatase [Gammaproteobacteria bacterium]
MTDISIAELEDFALDLARTAGGIAQAHFRRSFTIENKGVTGFDPVTSADRAIERVLRATIVERYPRHGIVAEEEGERAADSEYTWFIDPIDGTRSFMTGSPLWGTLVGLTRGGVPVFGLLCQPVLEEIFFGGPSGAWLIKPERRERLKARSSTGLANAVLTSTHPDMFADAERRAFEALARRCLLHRFGGDCYNYAMLAAGFVDLVVESQLKPFDIVPLIPILEGAGAVVTDWQGRRPMTGGAVVAAGTAELHAAALELLTGAARA